MGQHPNKTSELCVTYGKQAMDRVYSIRGNTLEEIGNAFLNGKHDGQKARRELEEMSEHLVELAAADVAGNYQACAMATHTDYPSTRAALVASFNSYIRKFQ